MDKKAWMTQVPLHKGKGMEVALINLFGDDEEAKNFDPIIKLCSNKTGSSLVFYSNGEDDDLRYKKIFLDCIISNRERVIEELAEEITDLKRHHTLRSYN